VKKSNGLLAVAAAIAANALWGSTFMASKVILAQCPPLTATLIRFSIAIALFAIVAAVNKADAQIEVVKSRPVALIGLGLVGYTGLYTLQMIALKHIASSQSAAIMLLAPVFTLTVESALKGSIKGREAATTAVGLLGAVAILFDQYKVDLSGIAFQGLILTILASACLGVSVVQTKRLLVPKGDAPGFTVFNLTFYSLLIGVIGLLPFVVLEQRGGAHFVPLEFTFWLWLGYLGVVCSVAAFLMWNWAIKNTSPSIVAVAMYIKTPVALGLGAALLHEHLTPVFYAGTTIILGTLFTNHLMQTREAK
jgi:drug/metabolite transporter (DMT)-like permease